MQKKKKIIIKKIKIKILGRAYAWSALNMNSRLVSSSVDFLNLEDI